MSKEREALEKIKFEAEFNGNEESVKKIFDIAQQALAPQECDVSKCEFYDFGYCRCGDTRVPQEVGYTDILCSESENCYYKQLHSQQKTFTLEEIKTLLYKNRNKIIFCSPYYQTESVKALLAEFEKEGK